MSGIERKSLRPDVAELGPSQSAEFSDEQALPDMERLQGLSNSTHGQEPRQPLLGDPWNRDRRGWWVVIAPLRAAREQL
jgi:hypothetical protein